jgi:GTP-binding protein
MRREGYELQVSQPHIIKKEVDGVMCEPFEELTIDVPTDYQGVVIEKLGNRKGLLMNMVQHDATVRLLFEIPTRGLLGYRGQFIVDTKRRGYYGKSRNRF